jgi:thioredoxin 1
MKGNFNNIIKGDKPVLVDFHAEWCGPCKSQSPIIKEVAKEINGKVRVIKIDVDKNQAIAQRFNVRGVPTLALFKNGQIIWRQSGVQTKQQLINVINQNS